MTVPAAFAHAIPDAFTDAEAAPLLCAGAIGYRSLRLTGLEDGQSLGLTGFGASAHLVLKLVRHRLPQHPRLRLRPQSRGERAFARELGAAWAGDTAERPRSRSTPSSTRPPPGRRSSQALGNLEPGGRLVINAIRKEDADKDALLGLDYPDAPLAGEGDQERRQRHPARRPRVPAAAAEIPLKPEVEEYPLAEANRALVDLKEKKIRGGKVLRIR